MTIIITTITNTITTQTASASSAVITTTTTTAPVAGSNMCQWIFPSNTTINPFTSPNFWIYYAISKSDLEYTSGGKSLETSASLLLR